MENDQQQRACENCRKQFPADKIDLHEAYCFRNIKKCPKCDKMVDINEQQTHQTEQHSNKQCQMCNQSFSPQNLQNHMANCPRKPVDCQFCQNTYAMAEILKHQEACGSRTQPCTICQKLVMIKQVAQHTEKCQRRAEERRAEERRAEQRRAEVSQEIVRNHSRNENEVPQRQRQNSQNVRDRKKSETSKNVIPKPAKIKPSHMIGPQTIKPIIDPVPISIRMAMKAKEQNRLPLKSKN